MHLLDRSTSLFTISHGEGRSRRSINLRDDVSSLDIVGDLLGLNTDILNTRLETEELVLDDMPIRVDKGVNLAILVSHQLNEIGNAYHNKVRETRLVHIELLKLSPVSSATEQSVLRDITSRLQIGKHIECTH